ncbi:MAG: FGGY-family carbohydrate kinase [Cytophagaceae bacterium]
MKYCTAVFDIGKTNKKLLLFDRDGLVISESCRSFEEIEDDDGFPCDDIAAIASWVREEWNTLLLNKNIIVESLNFTSYGASFVHLDQQNHVCTPLYNYLKPFPDKLATEFYQKYGGELNFSVQTASPAMGMLNSGLQLYWLKYCKPELFQTISSSLHLPQYLSFLFTGKKTSEYTSIGCHTALWDFEKNAYHRWVEKEGILNLFPEVKTNTCYFLTKDNIQVSVGGGLHDSSSALIPYKKSYKDPFLLISTGTWCIVLNPYNRSQLKQDELSRDCLNFLSPEGKAVRASRVFLGMEHDFQAKRIAAYFNVSNDFYKTISYSPEKLRQLMSFTNDLSFDNKLVPACMNGTGPLPYEYSGEWDLAGFKDYEEAYYQLILDLTSLLKLSVLIADDNNAGKIFVDGGFSKNFIFMQFVANHFPEKQVMSSEIAQATALGAALEVNELISNMQWNLKSFQADELSAGLEKYFKANYL